MIDREDDTWRLPETYNVSYCEECVVEHRNKARFLEANSVEEGLRPEKTDVVDAVTAMIELNWRYLRDAFRPDDPSNLETIPVGGEEA